MSIPHPHKLLNFTNKIAIVTGSGSGLGTGIAMRFAQAGAAVVINYRSSAAGAQSAAAEIEDNGGRAIAIQADVTKKEDVERLVNETITAFGKLDVLINNSGTYPLSTIVEMAETEWDAVIDTNLRSVFLCTQAAAKQMISQGNGGAIVNIASIEGENPAPMHSHYNAAKGGVLMHTRSAANELGSHGIRVNAVSPGLLWRKGIEQAWPDGVKRWQKAAPLTRLGNYDDIADACLFLASPAARWITGANLRVDGGVMTNQIF
ncbi:MAG: SDR family NAD(P)-dependent oxidoreductase [Chloroflexi bacterium]|nr:MAG: SDR family NAD(P)-dependent oxidoreductase [Chloroflexota bacterium]